MTLPKPTAVLFDWDDTIVDNWDTAMQAMNAALTHMGENPWSPEEARRRSGPSARDLFSAMFGDRWQEADRVYYETFLRLAIDNMKLHDHVQDILQLLDNNGVYMAVVSNKRNPQLQKEIDHLGFDQYFAIVVAAGEAAADKPDPAPILHALRHGNVTPSPAVWYIGDSHTDMMSASRAGCSPVLIETRPPPDELMREHPPVKRFRDHADIMEWLGRHFS